MRIMGLDITTHTGVSVVRYMLDHKPEILVGYEAKVPRGVLGMQRAGVIAEQVIETVQEHQPVGIMIEDYGFAFKGSAIVNVEITAIIKYFLTQMGYEYKTVSPNSVKQFMTGKGNADKNVVMKELYKRYGYDTDNDNIADACSLALFLGAAMGNDLNVPAERMVPVQNWLNPPEKKGGKGKIK